ncbi:MAG: hypothetical protein II992_04330 [Lachnospiraceae bacterium]|nr:hypothetical protein [Lachnospiraceae bacterium]
MIPARFSYVPANLALIEQGAKERVYQRVQTKITAYMEFVFEGIPSPFISSQDNIFYT